MERMTADTARIIAAVFIAAGKAEPHMPTIDAMATRMLEPKTAAVPRRRKQRRPHPEPSPEPQEG